VTSTYVNNLLWPSPPFSIAQQVAVLWASVPLLLIKNHNNNRGKPKSESKIYEAKDVGFFIPSLSFCCRKLRV